MSQLLLVLLFAGSFLALVGTLVLLARGSRPPRARRHPELVPAERPAEPPPLPVRRLLFAADSASLSPDARNLLATLAAYLTDWPQVGVALTGSADTAGSLGRNRLLARKRAQAAARVLKGLGVERGRIEVGWDEPSPARTAQERAELRSVRISWAGGTVGSDRGGPRTSG